MVLVDRELGSQAFKEEGKCNPLLRVKPSIEKDPKMAR